MSHEQSPSFPSPNEPATPASPGPSTTSDAAQPPEGQPQAVQPPAAQPQAEQSQYSSPAGQQPTSHQQPVYVVKEPTKKGFGVASMVLGICAILFSWTWVFGFILLALAFIFGIISLRRKESPKGFAITGIILGSVAVVIVLFIALIAATALGVLSQM